MSLISRTFVAELSDKEMRDAYLSAQTRTYLAYQIRALRAQRGWSQEQFAEKLGTSQSAVSRMEDRQYGKLNLQTLLELSAVFDCGLVVGFVPYVDFLMRTNNLAPENLSVPEFRVNSLYQLLDQDTFSPLSPENAAAGTNTGTGFSYFDSPHVNAVMLHGVNENITDNLHWISGVQSGNSFASAAQTSVATQTFTAGLGNESWSAQSLPTPESEVIALRRENLALRAELETRAAAYQSEIPRFATMKPDQRRAALPFLAGDHAAQRGGNFV